MKQSFPHSIVEEASLRTLLTVALPILLIVVGVTFSSTGASFYADSPEFALATVYLDIAHPAGFPLAHLSHALLPALLSGDIVARIGVSTAIPTALLMVSIAFLLIELTSGSYKREFPFLYLVFVVFLLLTPDFFKHIFALEAYLLNTTLLIGISALLLRYERVHDVRLLYFTAFVSGITLTNHAASVLFIAPVFLIYAFRLPKLIPHSILFGCLGLALYLYLPLRAHHALPMDSGSPSSWTRLVSFMSAERERTLREESFAEFSVNPSLWTAKSFQQSLSHDASRYLAELGPIILLLAAVGLIVSLGNLGKAGRIMAITVLSFMLASTQLFFLGWSTDPWFPNFVLILLFASSGIAFISRYFARKSAIPRIQMALNIALWLIVANFFRLPAVKEVPRIAQFVQTSDALSDTQDILKALPSNSTLLTEHLTFQAFYLHHVMGIRPDITLAHLSDLRFPKHFSLRTFVNLAHEQVRTADFTNEPFGAFPVALPFLAQHSHLFIEPSTQFFDTFLQIVRPHSTGLLVLRDATESATLESQAFAATAQEQFHSRLQTLQAAPKSFYLEARNLAEGPLLVQAHLLWLLGEDTLAVELLEKSCLSQSLSHSCGPYPLINLASYLIEMGDYERAIALLQYARELTPHPIMELELNLATAQEKLAS